MTTYIFDRKYLGKSYELRDFAKKRGLIINIMSVYKYVSKLDLSPTEFLYLDYVDKAELLVEYFLQTNDIKKEEVL